MRDMSGRSGGWVNGIHLKAYHAKLSGVDPEEHIITLLHSICLDVYCCRHPGLVGSLLGIISCFAPPLDCQNA